MAENETVVDSVDTRARCKYGIDCYRKGKDHNEKFKHPKRRLEEVEKEDVKKPRLDEDASDSGYVREEESDATSTTTLTDSQSSVDNSHKTSPTKEPRAFIKERFLVEMPEDFYDFWDFCKDMDPTNPSGALKDCLNIELVGPYDVLAGRCTEKNSKGEEPCYLRHWRYYYDPPEFLTVLRGDDATQFHLGYFRDDPKEMPAFVASNCAESNGTITPKGGNIFSAVKMLIDIAVKKEKNATKKKTLTSLSSKIVQVADDKNYLLEAKTKDMKARDKKVVCKSFHGAGIVVPVDDNEVGYREVPETPGDLKKMFKKIACSKTDEERDKHMEPLQEIICLVQFANDECDYGEGLELGLDLFTYGGDVFHPMISSLLGMAYQLLGRFEYADIVTAHLGNRKKGTDLDELS